MPADPTPVYLRGSLQDDRELRRCDYHGQTVSPQGGVQLTRSRWACAGCWKARWLRRGWR